MTFHFPRNAKKTEEKVKNMEEEIEESKAKVEKLEEEFKSLEEDATKVLHRYEAAQVSCQNVSSNLKVSIL